MGIAGNFCLSVDRNQTDPRARRAFGIESVVIDGWQAKISERVLCHWPYADLRVFSHIDPRRDQNLGPILVIAPLAGAFPVLLRDLVISLLRETEQVAVADWFDVRYLPLSRGRFGFDETFLPLSI